MTYYLTWLQGSLAALGYQPGEIDGFFGMQTLTAINQFKGDAGLPVNGRLGDDCESALLLALTERIKTIKTQLIRSQTEFNASAFACSCGCGRDVVEPLKSFARLLRKHFGRPLVILFGASCPALNREFGGEPHSSHISGEAFDCYFDGHMDQAIMAEMADLALGNKIGVIRYPNQLYCHFQIGLRNTIEY